jgi:phosphoribosylglycinamide formyltransferase-1
VISMAEFRYAGEPPMDVVFFFSGGASSMKAVLESPGHGKLYRVAGAFTNMPRGEAEKGYGIAEEHGLKVEFLDPDAGFRGRKHFYREVLPKVAEMEPDVVGLSGFLGKYSIIGDPLLAAYRNRILNVHPADLAVVAKSEGRQPWRPLDIGRNVIREIRLYLNNVLYGKSDRDFRRLYTGDDAVTMAVLFGEDDVCSTIHSVTEELDGGPILVQSKRLPVETEYVEKMLGRNAIGKVVEYAHELQGRMKSECDGPAFCKALELLAAGRMGIDDDFVTLDGEILPYGGFQME